MFSYTPKKFWEEVERLADAANQSYHEGLGGGKKLQQNAHGSANRSNKKVNYTKGVQQECEFCLLLGSTNRAKSHFTENNSWSAHDHKISGENVSNPPQNSDKNARQVHGRKGWKRESDLPHWNQKSWGPKQLPRHRTLNSIRFRWAARWSKKYNWHPRWQKSESGPEPQIRGRQRKCPRITGQG